MRTLGEFVFVGLIFLLEFPHSGGVFIEKNLRSKDQRRTDRTDSFWLN